MTTAPEWQERIESWIAVLRTLFYRPLAPLELEGFFTRERLAPESAATGPFAPMPPGTRWGGMREYGWFRTVAFLPEAARARRVVADIRPGGEGLLFLAGRPAGMIGPERRYITLQREGTPGARIAILGEFYAGHGREAFDAGPIPEGVETVPAVTEPQRTVERSSFGVWNEEAYQLWIDAETLRQLRNLLDADSLRAVRIDSALRAFTVTADPELPSPGREESFAAAREILRPLLECRNGSTAPQMYAFGHAHLDLAWLWPREETRRKAARTLSAQLELIREYPEYRFLQSQPWLYRRLAEDYPELSRAVREAVRAGRIIADGAMWVEADTNIPSGESLVRQLVHGKRFFREELGVDSRVLWLPDVFGYSGALPQIMRGCGVAYFSTAKIYWTYHGGDPFPYTTFLWEGIDGSVVTVHLCRNYNAVTEPWEITERWNERPQKDIDGRLYPFGWGDGGGGPTRDHLEFLRREADLEGLPRMRIAEPLAFFRDEERRGNPLPRYVGELYFQAHRGTYTSQARTKLLNRRAEIALREAEFWGTLAARYGFRWPAERADRLWKLLLFCQFHDILPGSSIAQVYEETERDLSFVVDDAGRISAEAAGVLFEPQSDEARAHAGELIAGNSLPFRRREIVQLPEDCPAGELEIQEAGGRIWAAIDVPPCGWVRIGPRTDGGTAAKAAERGNAAQQTAAPGQIPAGPPVLENGLLRLRFDSSGAVESIVDLERNRELAGGPCNAFRMYRDVPSRFDAWDIDSMYRLTPVPLSGTASFRLVADGPLVRILRIERTLHLSPMVQEVIMRRGSRRIDFRTVVDWREKHKLLKTAFPVAIRSDQAIHEIQFGHIRRPTHRSRPFDADRFEVVQQRWTALAEERGGCAILNDSKYGVSVEGNSIELTLLKAPLLPDMRADRGRQEFTYSFYCWPTCFADSGIVREGYALNHPLLFLPDAAASGRLPAKASIFSTDAENVVLETVKPAEDESGDIVLRLYEAMRTGTACTLRIALPIRAAYSATLLEEPAEELPLEPTDPIRWNAREGEAAQMPVRLIRLSFRPFEIRTLRLRPEE